MTNQPIELTVNAIAPIELTVGTSGAISVNKANISPVTIDVVQYVARPEELPFFNLVNANDGDLLAWDAPSQTVVPLANLPISLTLPTDVFSVNSVGNAINVTFVNQSAGLVFAGPATGSPGAPTFRQLVVNDIASLFADSGTIGFTFGSSISAVVKPSSITEAMLAFDVATQAELDLKQPLSMFLTQIADMGPAAPDDIMYFDGASWRASDAASLGLTNASNLNIGTIPNARIANLPLTNLANQASLTMLGNNTGSSAKPIALTVTQVKTLLNYQLADISGANDASNLTIGTLPNARISSLPLANLAGQPSLTLVGNNAGSSASPIALTAADVKTLLNIEVADVSGSNNASNLTTGTLPNARIANLPLTNLADVATLTLLGNNTGLAAKPIALTTTQVKTLLSIGVADVSGANDASNLTAGVLPNARISSLPLANLANIATLTILGNNLGSPNSPIALTASQVKTLLNIGIADVAGSNDASNLTAGILPNARIANLPLTNLANQASLTILGNNLGSPSSPIALTATQVKALLAITSADVTGSNDASNLTTGTLPNARIASLPLANLANQAALTLVGNNTGSSAAPMSLTASQAKTLLAIANTDVSGLGTASTRDVPASGNASTSQVVIGTDTRLTNNRFPINWIAFTRTAGGIFLRANPSVTNSIILSAGSAVVQGVVYTWAGNLTTTVAPGSLFTDMYAYLLTTGGVASLELSSIQPTYSASNFYYCKAGDTSTRFLGHFKSGSDGTNVVIVPSSHTIGFNTGQYSVTTVHNPQGRGVLYTDCGCFASTITQNSTWERVSVAGTTVPHSETLNIRLTASASNTTTTGFASLSGFPNVSTVIPGDESLNLFATPSGTTALSVLTRGTPVPIQDGSVNNNIYCRVNRTSGTGTISVNVFCIGATYNI